jgi:hypothetical protein
LYTITVLIFALNCARIALSTAHPRSGTHQVITLYPGNATLLFNEVTIAMILPGVDLFSEVYQEFLLLRQFFVSSKHHACRYLQLV